LFASAKANSLLRPFSHSSWAAVVHFLRVIIENYAGNMKSSWSKTISTAVAMRVPSPPMFVILFVWLLFFFI
jgi:hypothetical protein